MDEEKTVWTDPNGTTSSQCLHRRLVEAVLDSEGNKTNSMRCCECGVLVPRRPQPASLP
jgi:hypothetical protein